MVVPSSARVRGQLYHSGTMYQKTFNGELAHRCRFAGRLRPVILAHHSCRCGEVAISSCAAR
jgi:hypothetical protein